MFWLTEIVLMAMVGFIFGCEVGRVITGLLGDKDD